MAAEKKKKILIVTLQKLKDQCWNRRITHAEYLYATNKKKDGRSIAEWIEYYNQYITECKKRIDFEKENLTHHALKKGIYAVLSCLIIGMLFLYGSALRGFVIQDNPFYQQKLNLEVNESLNYTWAPQHSGELSSVMLSGSIEGLGSVKVYLDDILILDSDSAPQELSEAIVPLASAQDEDTTQPNSEEEALKPESPSQEEPLLVPEEAPPVQEETAGATNSEEQAPALPEDTPQDIPQDETNAENTDETNASNADEGNSNSNIIDETNAGTTNVSNTSDIGTGTTDETNASNADETLPPQENEQAKQKIIRKKFKDRCEETCNLTALQLNKTSYTLRIEIYNAHLSLDKITYTLIPLLDQQQNQTNITLPENATALLNETNITSNITLNETLELNVTSNVSEILIQKPATLNKSVEWTKYLILKQSGPVSTFIPAMAKNITVKKHAANEQEQSSFAEHQQREHENETEVLIEENESFYEVSYETPAPSSNETEFKGARKQVTITSPDNIHYENISSFSPIPESFNLRTSGLIKLRWLTNASQDFPFTANDSNGNGIIDTIAWITPHLSEQVFEIIIITKAEHLDENRTFVSNIYEQVKDLDNAWSEEISNNEFVRVVFEKNLT
ncbi:MAG: hypothetical protein Q7K43_05255, partial [Candidatus Woesearchaeota archaeon]|nr:hypothetical protein [Candidatus Woesearchaeota archaeon]